jgi:nucleotide-binding universal stress UspA family protein
MFQRALLPLDPGQALTSIKDIVQLTTPLGTKSFHLMHVLNSGFGKREQVDKWLGNMVKELQQLGFYASSQVIPEGNPASEICNTAEQAHVDYIYLPANRKNIIQRTLLGSTSQDVIRLTHKPTLIHKNRPHPKQVNPVASLLYATDFGAAAKRALPYVQSLVPKAEKILLLHAGQRAADPQAEIKRCQYVQENLNRLQQTLASTGTIIETYTDIGTAPRLIYQQAEKQQADIVILGRFNESPWKKVLGTTAEMTISKVQCSLLLIP